jgi:lipopolysaccharide transport system permease protein
LYDYRGFISGSVQREFQARYRNSLLGALWPIFNPLSMIVIYTVVFSHIMHARLPGVDDGMAYSIYLCAGLLAWGLFSEITLRSQNMFLDNANLLKKVSFPKICLPTIVLINAGINFAIIIGLFLGFLLITGRWPGVALLSLVPLVALQMMLCAGLGMVLGILNVFFRDVGQLFGICLQFWFWLTPIIYPITILPEPLQKLLRFNPLTNLIGSYQNLFVYGQWPIWSSLLPTFVIGAVFCTMGLYLFRKQVGAMEDEL